MIKKLLISILFCISFIAVAVPADIDFQALNHQIAQNPEQAFYELQSQLDAGVALQEKVKLFVVLSELAYYVDQPEHILHYVKEAIASGLLNELWYARALVSKARGHYQRRENKLFLITAQTAYEKAKQSRAPTIETAALIELIFANMSLGRDNQRETNLKLAHKYLSYLPSGFEKAILLQRYSTILRDLGRYSEAIKLIKDTIEMFRHLQSPHFTSISYYNLGRIEERQENFKAAISAMQLSYRWALKDKNYLNQAFSLSRMAEYQEKLQLLKDAKQSLELAKESAIRAQSSRVQLLTYKNIAEFTCRNEMNGACFQHLKSAIEHAKKSDLNKDKVELERYLASIYAKEGQYQKAYETLVSSIE
ncbi:tetratricopeptide repeat protein [Thalassotalea atypica]|uniref:tetratricopeptide repeat protein n=1 Tax=Thalassotalea atypica TaxID=2054316 RepID=UPI0025746667|nr:tetratricopeptide repeat protein [Thalassotalea atypica]